MNTTYVNRSDISYTEEIEYAYINDIGSTRWTAGLFGSLSTGENVSMSRSAATQRDAARALEAAIVELGWEIR